MHRGLFRKHGPGQYCLSKTNDIAYYEHRLSQQGLSRAAEYAFMIRIYLSPIPMSALGVIAILPFVQMKNFLVSFICLRHMTHFQSRRSTRPLTSRQLSFQSSLHQRHVAACMQGKHIVSIFCSWHILQAKFTLRSSDLAGAGRRCRCASIGLIRSSGPSSVRSMTRPSL